jgi:hypothetical protein
MVVKGHYGQFGKARMYSNIKGKPLLRRTYGTSYNKILQFSLQFYLALRVLMLRSQKHFQFYFEYDLRLILILLI